MAASPFTYEEAMEIAEDFEDLVDTDFKYAGSFYEIINVLIAPYSNDDKEAFILSFLNATERSLALSSYQGADYDVLIHAEQVSGAGDPAFIDIRSFTEEKGIKYNYPGE